MLRCIAEHVRGIQSPTVYVELSVVHTLSRFNVGNEHCNVMAGMAVNVDVEVEVIRQMQMDPDLTAPRRESLPWLNVPIVTHWYFVACTSRSEHRTGIAMRHRRVRQLVAAAVVGHTPAGAQHHAEL